MVTLPFGSVMEFLVLLFGRGIRVGSFTFAFTLFTFAFTFGPSEPKASEDFCKHEVPSCLMALEIYLDVEIGRLRITAPQVPCSLNTVGGTARART